MPGMWDNAAVAEQIGTAGCGGINAAYFAARAVRTRGARRFASALLALLFGGSALAALRLDGGAPDALAGVPLLVAQIATLAVLAIGARSKGGAR